MGLMGAVFHWTPDAFWRATPVEVYAMIEGFERANRVPDNN
jgi:hypothetical protein